MILKILFKVFFSHTAATTTKIKPKTAVATTQTTTNQSPFFPINTQQQQQHKIKFKTPTTNFEDIFFYVALIFFKLTFENQSPFFQTKTQQQQQHKIKLKITGATATTNFDDIF